eukprot:9497651-Pyramimonas_sp.AAC.1
MDQGQAGAEAFRVQGWAVRAAARALLRWAGSRRAAKCRRCSRGTGRLGGRRSRCWLVAWHPR